jgi:hemoglobin-like flavoprotein
MNFVEIFNDSYERAVRNNREQFFESFYRNFMAESENIAAKFKNTDMNRQKKMLETSLFQMVGFAASKKSDPALHNLANRHHQLGINHEYYTHWLEALLKTLRELDEDFTEQDAFAWRIILCPGIEFMKGYKDQLGET